MPLANQSEYQITRAKIHLTVKMKSKTLSNKLNRRNTMEINVEDTCFQIYWTFFDSVTVKLTGKYFGERDQGIN